MKKMLLLVGLIACNPETTDPMTTSSPTEVGTIPMGWRVMAPAAIADSSAFQVVDTRPRMMYDNGHVTGALHLDAASLRTTVDGIGGQALPREEARTLLENAGIDPSLPTVVYGSTNDTSTARAFWSLALYGSESGLRLMDGGYEAWTDMALPISTDDVLFDETDWSTTPMDNSIRIDKDGVLALLDDPMVRIFDVRTADEYAAGHIPGAQNVNWVMNLDADGGFISAQDTLDLHDDPTGSTVIVYCQSGARASVSWSLLAAAGVDDVRLYDGSWNEWGTDPDTPKVEGDMP